MSERAEFRPPEQRRSYPSMCAVCGGTVEQASVTLVYGGHRGEARIVHHVPAGVCQVCGERYLRPEISEAVEELLNRPPARSEEVPAWDFAAAG